MVYVGSRSYERDPTVSNLVIEPLRSLLYQSLFDPDNAIPTIQSAILVCMWPFPLNSTFKDPSNAIAGAAMNLAVQKGLPYASRKQDYARVALVQSETERAFRASLWAYCVVTFQGSVKILPPENWTSLTLKFECSTSLLDGLPGPQILDNVSLSRNGFVVEELPSLLRFEYQVNQVQSDAVALILREVDLSYTVESSTLNTLVDHFDTQVQRIPLEGTDDAGRSCSITNGVGFVGSTVDSTASSDYRSTIHTNVPLLQRRHRSTQSRYTPGVHSGVSIFAVVQASGPSDGLCTSCYTNTSSYECSQCIVHSPSSS